MAHATDAMSSSAPEIVSRLRACTARTRCAFFGGFTVDFARAGVESGALVMEMSTLVGSTAALAVARTLTVDG